MTARFSPIDPWRQQGAKPVDSIEFFGKGYERPNGTVVWRRDCKSVSELMRGLDTTKWGTKKTEGSTLAYRQVVWKQSMDYAFNGWDEGAKKLRQHVDGLIKTTSRLVQRPDPVYDVEGEIFDLGAYMTGVPEHWLNFEDRTTIGHSKTGPLRIVIQHASKPESHHLLLRGAIALALATLFERAGRPCEIVAANAGRFYHATFAANDIRNAFSFWTAIVKPLSRPINYTTMAFAIGHPHMETSVYYRAGRIVGRRVEESYIGGVLNVPVGDPRDTINLDYIPDAIALGNEDGVREYFAETLEAQGIQINLKGIKV